MKYTRAIGFIAAILLVIACFIPWVFIESKNIIVTGIESSGTNFGKPGYVHFVFCFLFFVFHSMQKVWAKRWNVFVVALNGAWAIRNYFIISICVAGECPEKQIGFYLVAVTSLFMLLAALFSEVKQK